MKKRLSFGYFTLLADNLLEVTVDDGVIMTLEMIDECHDFIDNNFKGDFGMLINRINNYSYTYEAQLSIASYQGLKAIAFVFYNEQGKEATQKLHDSRGPEEWKYKIFSGLELGWQEAYTWLKNELSAVKVED